MPTSGNSGCVTARSPRLSISSPSTSCPTGRTSPFRRATRRSHVDAIRRQWSPPFPTRTILVGEFGWPSAGRMREGALPSPVNQARVMHEVLAHAQRENYRVNLIEAYDQPWKRQLEGTVGGHWGVYDAYAGRRSSPGVARFPTIRTGAGRPRAAWGSPPSFLASRWPRAGGLAAAPNAAGVVAYRGNCDRLRSLDRLDGRERTARKPDPGRLAALPRLGRRRFDGTGRMRRGAGVRRAAAEFCADSRPRGATPPRRDGVFPRPHSADDGGAFGAGGARPGIRSAAIGISHSRRSPALRFHCLCWGDGDDVRTCQRPRRRWRSRWPCRPSTS